MKINLPRAFGLTILFSVCLVFVRKAMNIDSHILLSVLPSIIGWLLSFESIKE